MIIKKKFFLFLICFSLLTCNNKNNSQKQQSSLSFASTLINNDINNDQNNQIKSKKYFKFQKNVQKYFLAKDKIDFMFLFCICEIIFLFFIIYCYFQKELWLEINEEKNLVFKRKSFIYCLLHKKYNNQLVIHLQLLKINHIKIDILQ